MKMNKDMFKMTSRISLLLCGAVAYAAAADSTLVERQESLLNTLDSMNSSVMGLRVGGTAKAGVLSSTMSSDQLLNTADYRENQAYTDVNLKVNARPSAETEARVELRLHKDWQSAFDEGYNPIIGHWFSYDGKILDKHVDFNLGYMRVGYTPLTLYVPQAEILQEPEIFASKRVEALAYRNLDTTSNRLLQGLNAVYNSFDVGPLSNIRVQMTGARIRNIGKKADEVFFDFDWSDRYLYGANLGIEAFGATIGGNFVYTFDREKSSRSREETAIKNLFYEDNMVFSGVLGYDTKNMIMDGGIHAGLNAEIAGSQWTFTRDSMVIDSVHTYTAYGYNYPVFDENGKALNDKGRDSLFQTKFYLRDAVSSKYRWKSEEVDDLSGMALNVSPYVNGEIASVKFDVKGTIVKNDENFWSEQAAASYYMGGSVILNGDAALTGADQNVVNRFRSGSLENLYFSIYNVNVMQQQNLMSKSEDADAPILVGSPNDSYYTFGRLANNYRMGHFYKNGYEAVAYKRKEYESMAEFVDPSVNMAMPMGLATPDRVGFALNANVAWNDAVTVNVRFSQYSHSQSEVDNDYTTIGAGLGLDVAPFLGLNRRLLLQGSYESAEESNNLKRKTSRIIGGLTADVWGPFTLLGGVQMLKKEFGNGLPLSEIVTVNDIDEMLAMGGLQIKLGAGATLDLQGGLLTNTVNYTTTNVDAEGNLISAKNELGVDKLLIAGNITVLF